MQWLATGDATGETIMEDEDAKGRSILEMLKCLVYKPFANFMQHIPGALSHHHGRQAGLFYFDSEWFQVCFTSLELSREPSMIPLRAQSYPMIFIDFHWYALMIVDVPPPNSRHQVASKSWSTLHLQRSPWHLPFLREAVRLFGHGMQDDASFVALQLCYVM